MLYALRSQCKALLLCFSKCKMSYFGQPVLIHTARSITIMLVTISQKELDRISVLQQLYDKHLTLSRVAKLMDLGIHQVQRLLSRY